MRPEHEHYDEIQSWIHQSVDNAADFLFDPELFRQQLQRMWEKYDVDYNALSSFFRNVHLSHIKRTAPQVKANLDRSVEEYLGGKSILELAKQANYPPHLYSRCMVEAISNLPRKSLAEFMRDPLRHLASRECIKEEYRFMETKEPTRLAEQVQAAQDADPMYGPRHEKDRHMIGVEYEVVLEHYLREMGVPFETEEDLRGKGASKTPDVLLIAPLGVQVAKKDGSGVEWKPISWIDSKALFGDVHTHQSSVLQQAESYIHRFGPGLVLYWFGHAPIGRLGDAQGDLVIAGWQVPDKFMLPTGELLERRS